METMHHQSHLHMSELIIDLCPISADQSLHGIEVASYVFFIFLSLGKLFIALVCGSSSLLLKFSIRRYSFASVYTSLGGVLSGSYLEMLLFRFVIL
jgi:hypothetical protein